MEKGIRLASRTILFFMFSFFLPFSLHAEEDPQHQIDTEPKTHSESAHNEGHEEEEFSPGEFIIDHIKDSHEWHLWTTRDGHHVSVPLPIIIYSKYSGLHTFMSDKLAHGHTHNGFYIPHEGENKGKIIEETKNGEIYLPLDFSITRVVSGMIFASLFLIIIFVRMGRIYRKEKMIIP
jgi:F-type H+-transporting ATPase subunit a